MSPRLVAHDPSVREDADTSPAKLGRKNERSAHMSGALPTMSLRHALKAAIAFSSNFRPRPGLSGRTIWPFSIAGVSS